MWRARASGDFRIVRRNGGAGHHHFGAGNIFGAVSLKNRGAQTGQALGDGRTLEVGAGDLVAQVQQHLGDAAHADAADTDKMNALNFGEHLVNSCHGFTRMNADLRRD